MEEEDYLSKLTEFQYNTVDKMKRFEEFGGVQNGNTIIQSRIGILNLPEGFCRKNIISLLLQSLPTTDENEIRHVETIERVFHQSSITKKSVKQFHVSRASILVCMPTQIHRWKHYFKFFNIHCLLYLKKSSTLAEYSTNYLVLTTPTLFPHLIQQHFHQKAIERLIFYEPRLFRIKSKSIFCHYQCSWIVTSDINWLLFTTNHFIFKYIPESMEYLLFRQLCIFQEKKLVHKLWKKFGLKPYRHLEHQCQQEMYEILKGTLSDEMYTLLTEGNIQLVLEKLNLSCTKDSILKHLQANIQDEIDETEFQIIKHRSSVKKKKVYEEKKFRLIEKSNHLNEKFELFHQNTKCILCCGAIVDKTVLIYCCQNICCGNCIYRWLQTKNSCPFCRHVIQNDDLIPITTSMRNTICSKTNNEISKLMTKQNKVIELVDTLKEKHLVIFTKSKSISTIILNHYEQYGTGVIFEGNTNERKKTYEHICNQKCSLTIVMDENEMNGFSFPFVDHFISMSPLSSELFDTFLQKFHRLGRTSTFHIHTFMH